MIVAGQVVAGPREKTTLVAVLDWAFRRQKAHRGGGGETFGLRLGLPRDSIAKLEEMRGVLGCRIDGGQWKEIGHRAHPDAEAIVRSVGLLPSSVSESVWRYANAGTVPDWGEAAAYHPIMRENGKHSVVTATILMDDRRGRRSDVTVSYCPVELFPNPEYCREEWRLWYRGLVVLKAILPELTRWDVFSIGVKAEPWEKC